MYLSVGGLDAVEGPHKSPHRAGDVRGIAGVQVAVSGRGDQLDGQHPFQAEGDVRPPLPGITAELPHAAVCLELIAVRQNKGVEVRATDLFFALQEPHDVGWVARHERHGWRRGLRGGI